MISVTLKEWERLSPERKSPLYGYSLGEDFASKQLSDVLNTSGMLNVLPLKDGLQIEATSFVGQIQLGDLCVSVRPKLDGLPLLRLLAYAYRLSDVALLGETSFAHDTAPFQDLLIWRLVAEATNLLRRGLRRDYLRTKELLGSPRGRIDFVAMVNTGGTLTAALPCTHHPRSPDSLPNRILLAGLHLATRLTCDISLRSEVRKLAKLLDDSVSRVVLNKGLWRRWARSSNRLTENYQPALRLIYLLWSSSSISLEGDIKDLSLPGFLFDMNRFFQQLLTRFLEENLSEFSVRSEHRLLGTLVYASGWNPQKRHDPAPRPDFALVKNGKVIRLLDAKYRDVWETSLPRDMLYQLAIYALSGQGDSRAVLLFATTADGAQESRIVVRDPVTGTSRGMVLIRPVNLKQLDDLIAGPGVEGVRARESYAGRLVTAD